MAVLLVACGAVQAPTPGSEVPATATEGAVVSLPLTATSATRTQVVVVLGGSIMNEMAIALQGALADQPWVEVYNETGAGEGVADLSEELRSRWDATLEKLDPDVVITQMALPGAIFDCIGSTDEQQECVSEGRRLYAQAQLEELRVQFTARGAHMMWVGFPPTADSPEPEAARLFDERTKDVNIGAAKWAAAHSDVTFVATRDVLGLNGVYSSYLPDGPHQWRQARKPDGIHLCPHGAALAADEIASTLIAGWEPDLNAAWVSDSWRRNDEFYHPKRDFDPPVLCTDEPAPQRLMINHASVGSPEADIRG